MIRKSITSDVDIPKSMGLALQDIATFEVSSEDPDHPLENAFNQDSTFWSAAAEGEQSIRIRFDVPQDLRRIFLRFDETKLGRTQEFLLSWLPENETTWQELRRQQFNFSPPGTVTESEDVTVNLNAARGLHLKIKPRIEGGGKATLTLLKVE